MQFARHRNRFVPNRRLLVAVFIEIGSDLFERRSLVPALHIFLSHGGDEIFAGLDRTRLRHCRQCSLPGIEIASYQIADFLLPSLSKSVVICLNVVVLYQLFTYFFRMAAMRSSLVLIALACATAANASTPQISNKKRIIQFS